MSKAFSRIFVLPSSETKFVLMEIMRLIKANQKSEIHFYCNTKEDIKFYKKYYSSEVMNSINKISTLYENLGAKNLDSKSVIEQSKVYEDKLGYPINYLAVSDRHLGRGYALGGFKHPRSRYSQETTYLQMLNAYNKTLKYWEDEINLKNPTLIIGGGKILATIARSKGIPYRFMAGSRYKNYFYWAEDEYFYSSRLKEAFDSSDILSAAEVDSPYKSHLVNREIFLKSTNLLFIIKSIILLLARRTYWRLRRYEKGRGYFTLDELFLVLRRWKDGHLMTGKKMHRLSDMGNSKFVYYPLHTEPETALQTLSPEYFYQLSCIAALSRDLPAGTVLAVKDTLAAIGRRPRDFYAQILEFKNVVLLDVREFGLEVAKKSSAVATITGTGGFEAAVMGKPVISFGRHNLYNFLSHVRVINDETKLKEDLVWALKDDFDVKTAKIEGAKFLEGVKNISFNMEEFTAINGKNFSDIAIKRAYENLYKSINGLKD
tara:strand:- start:38346 stop:39812 length:1467 start_codon:yes stop_codon:yes gene_type:complete